MCMTSAMGGSLCWRQFARALRRLYIVPNVVCYMIQSLCQCSKKREDAYPAVDSGDVPDESDVHLLNIIEKDARLWIET